MINLRRTSTALAQLAAATLLISIAGCNDSHASASSTTPGSSLAAITLPQGAEHERSIEGLDGDGNGVRDDIQVAIYERHPDDVVARKVMAQQARSLQLSLLAGASLDRDKIRAAAEAISAANACLVRTVKNPMAENDFIERVMVNTSERRDAYFQFNQAMDGTFTTLSNSGADCP